MDTIIKLERVTKEYVGPPRIRALDSVDLAIHKRDFLAITGRSGSGKSTLLRLIGLLDNPTSGEISFHDTPTSALSDRRKSHLRGHKIGFVFQTFRLLNERTTVENVLLGDAYAPLGTRSERASRAMDLLDALGLAGRADTAPGQLSGGQQQRVAVARALMCQPALLLCDEPTGNLDSTSTSQLLDIFEDLGRLRDIAIVIATHDRDVQGRVDDSIELIDGHVSQARSYL